MKLDTRTTLVALATVYVAFVVTFQSTPVMTTTAMLGSALVFSAAFFTIGMLYGSHSTLREVPDVERDDMDVHGGSVAETQH